MCLAIFRPRKSGIVPQSVFENAVAHHPDGFGFVAAVGGKLVTYRSMSNDGALLYKAALPYMQMRVPMALHFRWATHGTVNLDNTHPVIVHGNKHPDGGLAFVHNGILSEMPDDKKLSDTRVFGRKVLSLLHHNWWNERVMRDLLSDYIGKGNKIVLLHASGQATILNSDQGIWKGGIWYSNDSFKSAPYKWARDYVMTEGGSYADWWSKTGTASKMAQKEIEGVMEAARKDGKSASVVIRKLVGYATEAYTVCHPCRWAESTKGLFEAVDLKAHAECRVYTDDNEADAMCDMCGINLANVKPLELVHAVDVSAPRGVVALTPTTSATNLPRVTCETVGRD